ncbi:MAG: putative toxin-antitoxin system toxin component, PIN family [Candidatus Cyclobacteriaceae bacterium M2_1C_046]
MLKRKKPKVVIDTNVWISFLIGKKLGSLKSLLSNQNIQIIISNELIDEIEDVTNRPKLRKYFPKDKIEEFINLLRIISLQHSIKVIETICRDPKDDFLLALSKETKADYLVTGDNDLLSIEKFGKTRIVAANEFEEIIKTSEK